MPALKKSVYFIYVLLFLCMFLAGTQSKAQVQKLSYRFSINTSVSPVRLQVELSFQGSDTGVSYVQLPNRWANQENLYKALTAFSLRNNSFSIEQTSDSSVRRILHKPGELIKIVYSLQQDWTGPLDHPKNYRAVINPQFIHATGFALLVTPQQNDSTPVEVTFDWTAMPKRWTLANSFHTGSRKWNGKVKLEELRNAIFVGGDYRLYSTSIQGKPIHLAIRGKEWKFKDTALLSAIEKVMTSERNFWNDHSEPYYLVTMTPLEVEHTWNGSALHQSFLACLSPDHTLDWNVYSLLSHEYFHRWNGVAMMMPGKEQEHYWFSEGFTEYYTYKILRRAGLLTQEEHIQKTNLTIAEYYLSPVRQADRKTMAEQFWLNKDYNKLPYKKGFVYALLLDHLIATRSGGKYSLDDLMFGLIGQARRGHMPTDSSFVAELKKLSGEDLSSQHYAFINDGATIPVAKGSLGSAVEDTLVQLSSFELGFNWEASLSKRTITGVVENTAAWKAGLRNGQKLSAASVHFDNTALPAAVTIKDGDQTIEVKYIPVSDKKEWVRQFRTKTGQDCAAH